jgi:Holliday junction resolvase
MRESAIQSKIRQKLESSGWIVNKIISCSLNGWPDLLAVKKSRAVFIEVKRQGENPDPLQEYRHKQLQKENMEVIIARSLDDVLHLTAPP